MNFREVKFSVPLDKEVTYDFFKNGYTAQGTWNTGTIFRLSSHQNFRWTKSKN